MTNLKSLRTLAAVLVLSASFYSLSLLVLDENATSLRDTVLPSWSNLWSSLPLFLNKAPSVNHLPNHLPSGLSYGYAEPIDPDHESSPNTTFSPRTLGVASHIYVVSLPRRVDRRARLERLMKFLDLEWTWWDATSAQDPLVTDIMERVRWERAMHAIRMHWGILPAFQDKGDGSGASRVSESTHSHLHLGSHSFREQADIEAEDPIDWSRDAVANLRVYPPLVDTSYASSSNLLNHTSHSSDSAHSRLARHRRLAQSRPFDIAGSELWTLDPETDPRSEKLRNPIPTPPNPDLRLPLPCAPLQFMFDTPVLDPPVDDLLDIINDHHSEHDGPLHIEDVTKHSRRHLIEPSEEDANSDDDDDEESLSDLFQRSSPYPFHLTLSRGMIACWNSHFRLLRHIANGQNADEVAIVLEDDVDIEFDARGILESVWSGLPEGWDIVFLGHCWSPHEDFFPPLPLPRPHQHHSESHHTSNNETGHFRLHPSLAPKCTHAYAVTRSGAARIVKHLRSTAPWRASESGSGRSADDEGADDDEMREDLDEEAEKNDDSSLNPNRGSVYQHPNDRTIERTSTSFPPPQAPQIRAPIGPTFAYSRALDQALVRLIQGRRISAFSLVPSIVVQTKESASDINPGKGGNGTGSTWRDWLVDSSVERMRKGEEGADGGGGWSGMG